MAQEDNGIVQQLLGLGEDRMGEVLNQLLANEGFVTAMQTAISQGIAAKRSVDSTVGTVLGAVNVPTLEDMDQVRDRLVELEDVLAEVEDRAKRLVVRVEAMTTDEDDEEPPSKPKKSRKAKTAKSAKKTKTTKKKKKKS